MTIAPDLAATGPVPGAAELAARDRRYTDTPSGDAAEPNTEEAAAEVADPITEEATAEVPSPRKLALSPSRAGDFKACPLLYRFRAIDRLPEPSSRDAVRGTLVHAVLERMFTQPAPERTPTAVSGSVRPLWAELSAEQPDWHELVPEPELAAWLDSAESLVRSYFTLEDPSRFSPEACELAVEIELPGEVRLRGFIDRVDLAPTGQLRIVDYKTGRAPSEQFEGGALYQLKFYALMIYRLRGVVPAQLKLLYLADVLPLVYTPTEDELIAFERSVLALWTAVITAVRTGDFQPHKSRMCGWCHHQALCPEYGGTPPPYEPGDIALGLPWAPAAS